MGRINTNVQSMIAQRVLSQNNQALGGSLERLSTGLRINRGKDDPAGLIASENLRSEEKSLNQAVTNAERADQVVNIAEGGLQEVSGLLTELQGLLTATASRAGLSSEEKTANQLQIDSILQTIDRVASATNFQGTKLLNGNLDFRTSSIAAGVTDYKINSAKFSGDNLGVSVLVTDSAQQGALFLSMGATSLALGTNSTFVIEVGGSQGSRELSFAGGTSLDAIADAINSYVDVTGVRASVSGTMINLSSDAYGSAEYVSVKVVDDGGINVADANAGIYRANAVDQHAAVSTGGTIFTSATNGIRDDGQDIGATINGVRAIAVGKTARVSTDFLNVELTLDTSTAQQVGNVGAGANPALYITGGGADFQLSSKADISGKVALGVQDVAVRRLGSSELGFLSSLGSGKLNNVVDGDILQGQKVVAESIKQLSSLRGRLGAFQKNTVGATIRSLGIAIENTAAAQSIIRDANFAEETAGLTRAQILVSSSTQVLGLANQQPQAALQLLG
jgi:flagellin